jgi:hypothetical protein
MIDSEMEVVEGEPVRNKIVYGRTSTMKLTTQAIDKYSRTAPLVIRCGDAVFGNVVPDLGMSALMPV